MSIFQTNISLLNKFLKQFTSCFSKKQLAMFTICIYAICKEHRRRKVAILWTTQERRNLQCRRRCSLRIIIKKHFCHKVKYVKYPSPDGSEVSHKTYSFEAKLKDCDVPIKFVVVLGNCLSAYSLLAIRSSHF